MTLIVAVTAGVPCLVLLTYVPGLRRVQSAPFAQRFAHARAGGQRSIALQTIIIIMVVCGPSPGP